MTAQLLDVTVFRGERTEAEPRTRLRGLLPRPSRDVVSRAPAMAALDRDLDLVGAWCLRAIAAGWDSRRLGYPNESAHPFELEVGALLGEGRGHARDAVAAAEARVAAELSARAGDLVRASGRTPLGALAAEFGLSPRAAELLLVVAAPLLRGELARLYAILANDPGRAMCDELLVAQLLGADGGARHDVARELDAAQPLVRHGLIQVAAGRPRPFAALTVDPVVVARLTCTSAPATLAGAATSLRRADRALPEIVMPAALREEIVGALAARPRGRAVRLVLRGREGSGRRTLLAALSRRARRRLAVIDVALLPQATPALVDALRLELGRAFLLGHLPCVANLDAVSLEPAGVADQLRELFRNHPAPIAFRCEPEARPPLDAGFLCFDLPALEEGDRLSFWRSALSRAGLRVRDVETLAARWRVTPGVIERAVAAARSGGDRDGDSTAALERVIRQSLDDRLGATATRITRLAEASSAVLDDDVAEKVGELIGRLRHRRQVYEGWGMGRVVTTSRGLTALFQGGPGTGKTMVAGMVARELGLDLYRVDVSRVMSKWLGETERNLASVFDAAEDAQAVLLFDEADSLFSKRTEVKNSNDRFANVVVNYLLQRLDSFQGIAILTTNFGGAIDPAFRRRLSFTLSFPFPDEQMRERLWRVHMPPELPVAGALDIRALARQYAISGGYIRNAAVRAAFLAAQAGGLLSQEHLVRAVTLEYQDNGKLAAGGTLE